VKGFGLSEENVSNEVLFSKKRSREIMKYLAKTYRRIWKCHAAWVNIMMPLPIDM